ncbi:DUF551 domain-containing protein [Escherichia coli]|nr:DUF551 domain-containing protein [Escherichia coli O153]EGX8176848.1 DUF551 domain-containing protein [Salmonella enterica subsp. enterica serovar Schwarzengrund]EIK0420897.1 DUF551 domain-containing protein [Escherichia coli]HCJ0956312.1 DUF551 domain-containing protein [Salmonella enterica]MCA4849790.1 DUF551 domain-containing protein [Escherichia coli]
MNTLTKEWLQNTITSIESARDEIPFGLDEDQNNMLTALKIALASLASLAAVSDERAAYELFMEKRFGESVDRRRAKNGDREYMAWDMALGWIIWCHRAAMLQGSQPVSQTYNLPELIEGMEVSIDVSTCDADLGNRYFGTVTEALELDTAKNGYILLVQDAEPNFDVNGNSPVTPDSWISCSDQMPEKGQNVLISVNFDSSLVEPLICSARYTGSTFRRGDATIKPGNGIEQATHWMPLPEPPQEVK